MTDWRWPSTKTIILGVAAFAVFVAFGAVLFAWSGVYNVAASRGHFAITRWFLELGMKGSVRTHSLTVEEPPPLDTPDRIRLGASVYQGQCAMCHGSPGQLPNPIMRHMLPPPPHLNENKDFQNWEPEELFWIVKHGLKYTAMPAWVSQQRDDEVWSVVAFLRKLPELSAQEYRSIAQGDADGAAVQAAEITKNGTGTTEIAICARCHGDEDTPPQSNLVPKLAAQPTEYLVRTLQQYARGTRQSGIMQPVAAELTADQIKGLADYYAGLPLKMHRPADGIDTGQIARGQQIASEGIPAKEIPACVTCHAGTGLPTYPTLIGQNAAYIAQQLQLWQQGLRNSTEEGQIMAPIARRLSDQQIEDVAVYFASLGATASSDGE